MVHCRMPPAPVNAAGGGTATIGTVTSNGVAENPIPIGVVTEISPSVAPKGTVTVICESALTLNVSAGMPLNDTSVAPVKFDPVRITTVPIGPDGGAKLVIEGGCGGGATPSGRNRSRRLI